MRLNEKNGCHRQRISHSRFREELKRKRINLIIFPCMKHCTAEYVSVAVTVRTLVVLESKI